MSESQTKNGVSDKDYTWGKQELELMHDYEDGAW